MWKKLAAGLIALAIVSSAFLSFSLVGSGPEAKDDEDVVCGTGTVVYLDFEGGFYGIAGDDGKHYDPVNLDPTLRIEGLRIFFTAKIMNILTFHMWGTSIKIIEAHRT